MVILKSIFLENEFHYRITDDCQNNHDSASDLLAKELIYSAWKQIELFGNHFIGLSLKDKYGKRKNRLINLKLKRFYEEWHNDIGHSGGEYDLGQLLSIKGLKSWLSKHQNSNLNFVDIGCGKGIFLRDFAEVLTHQYQMNFHKVGIDLVKSSDNVLDEQNVEFIQTDLDGTQLPLEDNSVDIITCNHVLEHIFYTENLIQEFKRILKPTGICIISVPNLSAWINRLFLLFSIQPLGSEVSTEAKLFIHNHEAKFILNL